MTLLNKWSSTIAYQAGLSHHTLLVDLCASFDHGVSLSSSLACKAWMEEEGSEAEDDGIVKMLGVDVKGTILIADDVEEMVNKAQQSIW